MMIDFQIVTNHPDMLKYIDYLQHKNAEALSFYPMVVFERELLKQRLLLGLLNNQPCGYVYVGKVAGDVKIHQICIQYDLRRRLYGGALIGAVENMALINNCRTITLRCGFDLEANNFWQMLNYQCIGIVNGGARRMRKINIWRKYLQTPLIQPQLFIPAEGQTDATLWRKNKSGNKVSQFQRGKKLQDYRAIIISKDAPAERGLGGNYE